MIDRKIVTETCSRFGIERRCEHDTRKMRKTIDLKKKE